MLKLSVSCPSTNWGDLVVRNAPQLQGPQEVWVVGERLNHLMGSTAPGAEQELALGLEATFGRGG